MLSSAEDVPGTFLQVNPSYLFGMSVDSRADPAVVAAHSNAPELETLPDDDPTSSPVDPPSDDNIVKEGRAQSELSDQDFHFVVPDIALCDQKEGREHMEFLSTLNSIDVPVAFYYKHKGLMRTLGGTIKDIFKFKKLYQRYLVLFNVKRESVLFLSKII